MYSAANLGPRVYAPHADDGRAKQAFKDECDVNNIMARFQKTGAFDHFGKHGGTYGFADAVTFHEALTVVTTAESMFEDLPSSLRTRFEGDPAAFLDFVQDEANAEEMVEMGLRAPEGTERPVGSVEEPTVVAAVEVPVVGAAAPETPPAST